MISGRCTCGEVRVELEVENLRTSICHCFACKQRSGSVFGFQTRVEKSQFTSTGDTKTYLRVGDDGNEITHHFCPTCATTLFWFIPLFPEHVIVAVGIFGTDAMASPIASFYEERALDWFPLPESIEFRMD